MTGYIILSLSPWMEDLEGQHAPMARSPASSPLQHQIKLCQQVEEQLQDQVGSKIKVDQQR